jgi:hypothetical protein
LVHLTTNTGHKQEFGLCPENFDPEFLEALELPQTLKGQFLLPLSGWWVKKKGRTFTVMAENAALSENKVNSSIHPLPRKVMLETTLLKGAASLSRKELETLAELEQCVAIARCIKWREGWGFGMVEVLR